MANNSYSQFGQICPFALGREERRALHIKQWVNRLFGMEEYPADSRRSLGLILAAVFFGNIFGIITIGTPLAGFANALGAGDFVYGLMMGLPVLGSVMQLVSSMMLERGTKRRKMLIISGIVQRGIWLAVAAAPLLISQENTPLRVGIVIMALLVSNMGAAFVNISFWSLMSDVLPGSIRGRYMATRNRIGTISTLLGGVVCAFFLDKVDSMVGYSIVFFVASIFGVLDILMYLGVSEGASIPRSEKTQPIGTIIKNAAGNIPFRKMLAFWLLWTIGVQVSGPYFSRYALVEIHMTQAEFFLLDAGMSAIVTILVLRKWGRLTDIYGQKPVLKIGSLLACMLPLMWLLTSPRQFWILPFNGIVSGLGWGAVNLINANMMVTAMPQNNRSTYLALFFIVIQTIGSALPNIVGGWMLSGFRILVDAWGMGINPYKLLFITSTIIRLLAIFLLLPRIEEPGARTASELLQGEWRQARRDLRRRWYEGRIWFVRQQARRQMLREKKLRLQAQKLRDKQAEKGPKDASK